MRDVCSSLVLSLLLYTVAEGQITLSGPACVVPGTVYQYVIDGKWDSSATMQISLVGGRLADTTAGKVSAFSGRFSRRLLVVWNDSASSTRSLSLTSAAGNSTLTVTFTSPLHPGTIDSTCIAQRVGLDSIPGTPLTCKPATGGACSPAYRYQWQRSGDRMHWKDIPDATRPDLQIKSRMRWSSYYRRKVTETSTGSVGYSNEAAVFLHVDAVLPDSILKAIKDSAAATSAILFPGGKGQRPRVGQLVDKGRLEGTGLNRSTVFFTKPKEEPSHG